MTDGRNQTTAFSDYYRGVPRRIEYPTGTARTAQVNGQGWVTGVTDELGYGTGYLYDPMGRLARTTPPSGDSVAWTPTLRDFLPVPAGQAEYGLPAGHWRQNVSTGTGVTTTFYDGQWRPVLVRTQDTAVAGSASVVVIAYDAYGRETYRSYPVANVASYTARPPGVRTYYDSLGRVVRVEQDSELGVLATTTEYLSGYRTKTTDPRGAATTTSYWGLDDPQAGQPIRIEGPEGVLTVIGRDRWGRPLQVARSGPGG